MSHDPRTKNQKAANDFDREVFNLHGDAGGRESDTTLTKKERAAWGDIRRSLSSVRGSVRPMMSEADRKEFPN